MHTGSSDILGFIFILFVLALVAFLIRGVVGFWRGFREGLRHPSVKTNREKRSSATRDVAPAARLQDVEQLSEARLHASIFISYRRNDSNDVTGRIYDRLVRHFGKDRIFKDVDNVPLGVDFRKQLHDSVHQCQVLLAIIGKNWSGDEVNPPRIADARDYVRIEIDAALERDIPVIPVLVQGAQLPYEQGLPNALKLLLFRNGISVRSDPDFHQDVDRLIRGIEDHVNRPPSAKLN